MSYRDQLRARHNRLKRGKYPYRPEMRPGFHGIASDPGFWVRQFERWRPEEEAEAAEIEAAPQRRSRRGYEEGESCTSAP